MAQTTSNQACQRKNFVPTACAPRVVLTNNVVSVKEVPITVLGWTRPGAPCHGTPREYIGQGIWLPSKLLWVPTMEGKCNAYYELGSGPLEIEYWAINRRSNGKTFISLTFTHNITLYLFLFSHTDISISSCVQTAGIQLENALTEIQPLLSGTSFMVVPWTPDFLKGRMLPGEYLPNKYILYYLLQGIPFSPC